MRWKRRQRNRLQRKHPAWADLDWVQAQTARGEPHANAAIHAGARCDLGLIRTVAPLEPPG